MHRVGQNVHSEFSIGCHRRTWMNILANPTLGWQKAPERWRRCPLWTFWCFSELLPRDSLPRSRLSTQDRTCHTNAGENSGNPGQANAHKCLVTIWLLLGLYVFWWCCFCLVAKLCLTLCNSKDCSMPGFPVLHCLPEFAETQVHWVSDVIQPPCPLPSPSPPVYNLSLHQGLFQWVGSFHRVAKVLELQHQSFQWIFRAHFLWDWLVRSPCSPRDSQVLECSLAPQFESNFLVPSFLYGPALTSIHLTSIQSYWKKP